MLLPIFVSLSHTRTISFEALLSPPLFHIDSVGYNILNKKTLNILPLPVSLAALQLLVGGIWASCLWQLGLRQKPKLSNVDVPGLFKVACFHSGGQLATVLSLGKWLQLYHLLVMLLVCNILSDLNYHVVHLLQGLGL